jgi:hypothetical protein
MGSRTIEFYDDGRTWRNTVSNDSVIHSTNPDKVVFSRVSPKDSIAYAPSNDKIHYTRGTVLERVQRRSAFKKVFVAPPPPPPTYDEIVSADNPVARWKLDELIGTTANDSVGTNHGTYAGATLNQAPLISVGSSILLSGSSSGITIPDAANLSFVSTGFALECFIKSAASVKQTLISKSINGSIWPEYHLFLNTNGTVQCEVRSTNADTPKVTAVTTLAVNDGTAHHIVAVFTPGTTLKIYVDGAETASTSHSLATSFNSTSPLRLGNFTNTQWCLNGYLDEVALYGSELLGARVLAHYNAGIGI